MHSLHFGGCVQCEQNWPLTDILVYILCAFKWTSAKGNDEIHSIKTKSGFGGLWESFDTLLGEDKLTFVDCRK